MDFQRMSESEAAVMQVLWNADAPMTSAAVIEALNEEKAWKPSTVWTFLGRLVDKNLLSTRRKGKANFYIPALSEEEYRAVETRQFLQSVHGGSVKSFFAALSGGEGLSGEELGELERWLKEEQE